MTTVARRLAVVNKAADKMANKVEAWHDRAWRWVLKSFLIVVLTTAAMVWASYHVVSYYEAARTWATNLYGVALSKVTRVEVRKEVVRPGQIPLPDLIKAVAKKYKVPSVVLEAVVDQESSGGQHLYRFEQGKYTQLKSKVKAQDSEVRMLASSHGVAHVMGFNAQPRCGVHWSQLYDQLVGLECGAKIIRDGIERHSGTGDSSKRIWLALRDYNGSGADAEAYANRVMAQVGSQLLRSLARDL